MKLFKMNYKPVERFNRHLRILLRHLTLKRIINVIISIIEYFLRKSKLIGKPFLLKVEPCGFCNLKCYGCRSGITLPKFQEGMMDYEVFERIITELKDYLIEISLYLWGEPLMNKNDICRMVELTSRYNIGSIISTNLHFMNEELAEGLIKAKLDKLIVAIDGVTQKNYEKIRIGGKLDKVMKNLKLLVNCKKNMNSKYPFIEWQFIRTDFNKNEIPAAREVAERLNINYFALIPDWGLRESDPETEKRRLKTHKVKMKICDWLWSALAVQWNGDVYPCCHVARNQKDSFGNIINKNLLEIWNSPIYIRSRRKFAYFNKVTNGNSVCFRCPM